MNYLPVTRYGFVSNIILGLSFFMLISCEKETCNFDNEDSTLASLDFLVGKWTRTESNNPVADGMIINVSGNSATVLHPSGASLSVGDIKWKSITPETESSFTHEELGSDGLYYPATIDIVNDTTISIVVGSSGAGNTQNWIRGIRAGGNSGDGGDNGNGPTTTQTLECSINTETVLKNGIAAVDYKIAANCVVDITAALTIEPGVVIEFEENAGLGVYDQGSIKVIGTEASPITLKGAEDVTGYWRGIHIETNSFNNIFEHATIENAGSNYVYCCNEKTTILLKDGQLKLSDVTINKGAGYGLTVRKNATLRDFSNVSISNNEDYLASLDLARAAEIPEQNLKGTGNTKPYIFITGSSLAEQITLWQQSVPFLFEGEVFNIQEGLTIEKGVEIVMEQGAGIGVFDDGWLAIKGSSDNPVVFRGEQSTKGYWRGIHVETNSLNNDINYLQLSDAGSNYVYCCNIIASMFFKDGKAQVKNSTISNGKGYGVATGSNFIFNNLGFTGNTITTHDNYPVYVSVMQAGDIGAGTADYSGNQNDYIAIYNSDLNDGNTSTLSNANVPYLIENNIVLDINNGQLALEAGVELVMSENAGIGVYDDGSFNATGTSGNNITIRGEQDIQGYWRGIYIETNNPSNQVIFSNISNAGSNYVYCCNEKAAFYLKSGQLTVENCAITKTDGCAIFTGNTATLNESGNSFSENTTNLCP